MKEIFVMEGSCYNLRPKFRLFIPRASLLLLQLHCSVVMNLLDSLLNRLMKHVIRYKVYVVHWTKISHCLCLSQFNFKPYQPHHATQGKNSNFFEKEQIFSSNVWLPCFLETLYSKTFCTFPPFSRSQSLSYPMYVCKFVPSET